MPLKIYNTYSKRLEEFKPLEAGKVKMYNCGPTVYNHPHIGNFRAFLFADVLRRYLEFSGFEVTQVMNITDVGHMTVESGDAGEDRLEAGARREGLDPWKLAEKYAAEFFMLLEKLNAKKAYAYPKATDHIKEMIEIIQKLVAEGYAYVVNGNVYFEVAKFVEYGNLSGNIGEQLDPGARISVNPEKKNPADFALWKTDPKHIMQWESPWGRGFPGWHIECSAMSLKYLGNRFDIHTGGEDNIFPHHESEIAQSDSYNRAKTVNYWIHVRHLMVEGKKMAKSEGNFYTVGELIEKGFDPIIIRYLLISAQYRTQLNFTFQALDGAKAAVSRLIELQFRLRDIVNSGGTDRRNPEVAKVCTNFLKQARTYMDEDLNIAGFLSAVFEFVRNVNKFVHDNALGPAEAEQAINALYEFDRVIGVLTSVKEVPLAPELESMIKEREKARYNRDYAKADSLRLELRKSGVLIQDTKEGTRWRRL